jgi:toxin ParE1/3/4
VNWPRFDHGADEDIDRAVAYFANIGERIAADFAEALTNSLGQIARSPRRFAKLETNTTDREIRRVILQRFNYLVIYEVVGDVPIVLAVLHVSRHPDAWQREGEPS